MKLILTVLILFAYTAKGQVPYDSITISRSTIENDWHGPRWTDSLKQGKFKNYLKDEITIWVKLNKTLPSVISLVNRIRANGTEDVSKCFIPRHSINFYKDGEIKRYLLVCFECDGVRFSDEPLKTFIKNVGTRDKQMAELKTLFKDIL